MATAQSGTQDFLQGWKTWNNVNHGIEKYKSLQSLQKLLAISDSDVPSVHESSRNDFSQTLLFKLEWLISIGYWMD